MARLLIQFLGCLIWPVIRILSRLSADNNEGPSALSSEASGNFRALSLGSPVAAGYLTLVESRFFDAFKYARI